MKQLSLYELSPRLFKPIAIEKGLDRGIKILYMIITWHNMGVNGYKILKTGRTVKYIYRNHWRIINILRGLYDVNINEKY